VATGVAPFPDPLSNRKGGSPGFRATNASGEVVVGDMEALGQKEKNGTITSEC